MTKTNKEIYAETYAQAFQDSYPNLPVEKTNDLIAKAVSVATQNIRSVDIGGAAFKLTSKRLGIKHTYTAIAEYLNKESTEA